MAGTIGYSMSEITLGQELKRRRGERSLREMAERCGVDFSTLARIENGKIATPSRETLAAVSNGYGIALEYAAQLVYCGKSQTETDRLTEPVAGMP